MTSLKNELQRLSDWLNLDKAEFPWNVVSAFSPFWRSRKIISAVGEERTTARCNCDYDHEENVFYPKGEAVILCAHTGCSRTVLPEELRFWSFNGGEMAAAIGGLFQCKGEPQEIVGGKLWKLGMTAHRIGGIPCDIYFVVRMGKDANALYERLPQESKQAVLIVGSSGCEYSEHFPSDRIFHIADILNLTPDGLELKLEEIDARLGCIPKVEKKTATAGDHGKYVLSLNKELYEFLKSAYSFYTRGAGTKGEKYPTLTLRLMAERLGCAPTTVRNILRKKDETSRKEFKEIEQRWKAGQTREGIIEFGDAYFPSVKGFERR